MSGLGLVLDVAKEALLAQKYAIDVVSHNIANVNTPGYTRQSPMLQAKEGSPYGGVMLGRGVTIDEVLQNSDAFIESQLRDRKTDLMAMSGKEVYMDALEGIFNENSANSLSTQLSDFWNAWQDLTNNPSGLSERNILCERGALLSQSFQDLYGDLNQIVVEVGAAVKAGVEKVNALIEDVAYLNQQIIQIEVTGNANDLRDQRNQAVSQLAEYMDIKSYENEDGNLTVTTGRGHILVSRGDPYLLSYDGGEIKWASSGSSELTITDVISGGKIGGWLDMRDQAIPEYKADLDELAKAVIWETNKIHTQGVGLEAFSTVTGTYAASNSAVAMGTAASGLDFYSSISDGQFTVSVYDNGTGARADTIIPIDADVTTLDALATALDNMADLTASVSGGKLTITASVGHSFAFSGDTSNVLAALGVNTFFTGSDANDMAMNSALESNKGWIAAGRLGATGGIASGDNTNALAMANLQYTSLSIKEWTYERGSAATSSNVTGTIESYYHAFVGSIGIDSQSIKRSREFNEVIVNKLNETRDNISAVSIDEEMTKLIQYQHGYAAAAKLITAADEMLKILLDLK